jgi:hypothetical protein
MKIARDRARRYLPNAVDFYAAVAYAPDSEAALHTKVAGQQWARGYCRQYPASDTGTPAAA